jgi:hypothetical protein
MEKLVGASLGLFSVSSLCPESQILPRKMLWGGGQDCGASGLTGSGGMGLQRQAGLYPSPKDTHSLKPPPYLSRGSYMV